MFVFKFRIDWLKKIIEKLHVNQKLWGKQKSANRSLAVKSSVLQATWGLAVAMSDPTEPSTGS